MKPRICEAYKRNLGVKGCQEQFEKQRMGQKVCSPACAYQLVIDNKKLKRKKQTRSDRRNLMENDLSWWLRVDSAQGKMNGGNTAYWLHRWIRLVRDKDMPCVSCGRPDDWQWHAGHYRARGSAGHLRFNPDNIHKQCHQCNTRGSGNTGARYSANLVERIGQHRVTVIDNNNDIKRWKIEECREIRDEYKALCKEAGI